MTGAPCRFLEWDTNFFNLRVARVEGHRLDAERLSAVLDWCDTHEINLLYFLADADDALTVRLAEQAGFALRDIRITFEHRLHDIQPPDSGDGLIFRTARDGDLDALRQTARTAYTQSRFYYEPRIRPDQSARLYDVWLERSFLEDYAAGVVVAELDGVAVGYVTCHLSLEKKEGSIGLVGVAEGARGQRIGQQVVMASLDWFKQQGMETVSVVTQGRNIGAQRLYQKCGFLTRSVRLWYHKDFGDNTTKV